MRVSQACLAERDVVCRSCGDACPEAAIAFPLSLGGTPRPIVEAAACSGCGACVSACPTEAVTLVVPDPVAGHG
ncbi:MAG: 4Fe-4S dicluster domain-containing protein [Tistlia sp.]